MKVYTYFICIMLLFTACNNNKAVTHDCSYYNITTEKTEQGGTYIKADKINISNDDQKTDFTIMLQRVKNGLIIIVDITDNCIDENTKVDVVFEDNSRFEVNANAEFNCKGNVMIFFGESYGRTNELEELKTKKIKTMSIRTQKFYEQQNFSAQNSEDFINEVNCLMK